MYFAPLKSDVRGGLSEFEFIEAEGKVRGVFYHLIMKTAPG